MISQPLPVAVDRANIRQDAPKAKTRDSSRHWQHEPAASIASAIFPARSKDPRFHQDARNM